MGYDFTRHHVEDLGTVWINGEPFTGIGYQGLLTVNTKTYVSEPTRANDGSMPNIADHESFVVPRCKVNFKYMSLDDYQRLCNAILPNEFPVKYYDKQFGGFVEHYMYAEPEEMAKLYNVGSSVIGVLDYEVSFIGTRNKLQSVRIKFDKGNDKATVANLHTYTVAGVETYVFSDKENYKKGERAYYNGDYYEAIYFANSFSGQAPKTNYGTNETKYWNVVATPQVWSETTSYTNGQLVYVSITNNGKTTVNYYECVKDNKGASLDDKNYWVAVAMDEYSEKRTYVQGDYAYVTGSSDVKTYYTAIYYVDSFEGKPPTNIEYWKQLSILQPQVLNWGQTIYLPDQNDLFEGLGLNSANKWTVWLWNEDGTERKTSNYYLPNQTISVLRSMVLKATWE